MALKDDLKAAYIEMEKEALANWQKRKDEWVKKYEEEKEAASKSKQINAPWPRYNPPARPRTVFHEDVDTADTGDRQLGSYYQYSPIPICRLVELRQCLYDTEILSHTNTPNELRFFQRQIGSQDASGHISAKSIAETNLSQPGQLANPLEFDLAGFFLRLQYQDTPRGAGISSSEIDEHDLREIHKGGFVFLYTGNRIFKQSPISCIAHNPHVEIPQRMWPEDYENMLEYRVEREDFMMECKRRECGTSEFFVSEKMLRIRATENFQIRLEWPQGAPQLYKSVRITAVMDGLQRTPI